MIYHNSPAALSLHHLPPSPGLARCAADDGRTLVRRVQLGRDLAAALVRQGLSVSDMHEVRTALGYKSRQGLHALGDPTRPGIALSALLVAPRPFASVVLLGALGHLGLLAPPRPGLSPQRLVANVIAAANQVTTILDQRDLTGCTADELAEMAQAVAEQQQQLDELARRIKVARAVKGGSK